MGGARLFDFGPELAEAPTGHGAAESDHQCADFAELAERTSHHFRMPGHPSSAWPTRRRSAECKRDWNTTTRLRQRTSGSRAAESRVHRAGVKISPHTIS